MTNFEWIFCVLAIFANSFMLIAQGFLTHYLCKLNTPASMLGVGVILFWAVPTAVNLINAIVLITHVELSLESVPNVSDIFQNFAASSAIVWMVYILKQRVSDAKEDALNILGEMGLELSMWREVGRIIPFGLCVAKRNGIILSASDNLAEMLDIRTHQLIGSSIHNIIGDGHKKAYDEFFDRTDINYASKTVELEINSKTILVDLNVSKIKVGHESYGLACARNVSNSESDN